MGTRKEELAQIILVGIVKATMSTELDFSSKKMMDNYTNISTSVALNMAQTFIERLNGSQEESEIIPEWEIFDYMNVPSDLFSGVYIFQYRNRAFEWVDSCETLAGIIINTIENERMYRYKKKAEKEGI